MNDGWLAGPRVTWKIAFVSGPPPTISRWIAALMRAAIPGRPLSSASVPSTSGGKTKRIVRRGEAFLGHELRQRARDLEDRRAAAGVVVRAGARVVEMAAEDDLLLAQLRPRHRRRHELVCARLLPRADDGMHADGLVPREPLLQRARGFERDHERERLHRREGLEMSPADEVLVLAVPRGALVLRV